MHGAARAGAVFIVLYVAAFVVSLGALLGMFAEHLRGAGKREVALVPPTPLASGHRPDLPSDRRQSGARSSAALRVAQVRPARYGRARGRRHRQTGSMSADYACRNRGGHMDEQRYRRAELALWEAVGAQPAERRVRLERTSALVRIQEVGEGEPVVFVHGASNGGTS